MLRIKTEPTTSEKVKEAALDAAALATTKAQEIFEKTADKASNDIAPVIAAKAETARDAAAPHVEAALDQAKSTADNVKSAAADAKDAAAERRDEWSKEADKRAKAAKKQSVKKAKKTQKAANKKADRMQKLADKRSQKAEKFATKKLGVRKSQKAQYKAAALAGHAQAFAEDKGLTRDNARDMYQDELLPHLKEILAAAAAAGVQARNGATQAAQNAVTYLPDDAQKQVIKAAPALGKQKKGGKGLIVLGLGSLAGAGYLYYMNTQQQKAANAQLSETAISDSQAHSDDALRVSNPVTNFKHADDTTVVSTATEAGGPGTAATWTDTNHDGSITSKDLEGETRASRRENREGH